MCVYVGDHFARIVARAKDALEESVEIERFGAADFNGAIQRIACRDLVDRACDIVSRNWLEMHRWHANGGAVGSGVGDVRQEFEELRSLNN